MEKSAASEPDTALSRLPSVEADSWDWDHALVEPTLSALELALSEALRTRRWFASKTRKIARLQIVDSLPITRNGRLLIVAVAFEEGLAELYQIALAATDAVHARHLAESQAPFLWVRTESLPGEVTGALYDPTCEAAFCQALLALLVEQGELPGTQGTLAASTLGPFAELWQDGLKPRLLAAEQSNSSIAFGDKLILKLFRKIDRGRNPDLEISAKLTAGGFTHGAPLAGVLEYRTADAEPWTLGLAQQFVPNQGDAWRYTLDKLTAFLWHTAGRPANDPGSEHLEASVCQAITRPIPAGPRAALATFLADAELLGRRTAEMHLTLAAVADDPTFAPEPFTAADAAALRGRALALVNETFATLRTQLAGLSPWVRDSAESVLKLEAIAAGHCEALIGRLDVAKIRCHGDYHFGQVLVADGDFIIIDFEGEPARPLAERRQKQLALRDVAGMVRSFHYAACSAAAAVKAENSGPANLVDAWARAWFFWNAVAFVASYRQTAGAAPFVPSEADQFQRIFEALLLEKAVYELRYELNNRPDWVYLPLEALEDLLGP